MSKRTAFIAMAESLAISRMSKFMPPETKNDLEYQEKLLQFVGHAHAASEMIGDPDVPRMAIMVQDLYAWCLGSRWRPDWYTPEEGETQDEDRGQFLEHGNKTRIGDSASKRKSWRQNY